MVAAADAAWPGLVASAISTVVSRALTYPADTLKARLQVQGALPAPVVYRNTLHAFRQVLHTEGLAGFYRGFWPVLAGVLPATMVYFCAYETAKELLPRRLGRARDFAVGTAAQLCAGVVFTPVDVVKERLQVQRLLGADTTALSTIRSALRADGPAGLLRGYWGAKPLSWVLKRLAARAGSPTASGSPGHPSLYEASKRATARQLRLDSPADLPGWAFAACSGAAAAAAALATHPLDVVKTRLQVLTGRPGMGGTTAGQIARDMLRQEGLGAFAHGCTARMLQIAPGAAISWLLYESVKRRLQATTAARS